MIPSVWLTNIPRLGFSEIAQVHYHLKVSSQCDNCITIIIIIIIFI